MARAPHPIIVQLGPLIRHLRTERRIEQCVLAKAAGMSSPYLSKIEHGEFVPSLHILLRIADALAVPAHELLIAY